MADDTRNEALTDAVRPTPEIMDPRDPRYFAQYFCGCGWRGSDVAAVGLIPACPRCGCWPSFAPATGAQPGRDPGR